MCFTEVDEDEEDDIAASADPNTAELDGLTFVVEDEEEETGEQQQGGSSGSSKGRAWQQQ